MDGLDLKQVPEVSPVQTGMNSSSNLPTVSQEKQIYIKCIQRDLQKVVKKHLWGCICALSATLLGSKVQFLQELCC